MDKNKNTHYNITNQVQVLDVMASAMCVVLKKEKIKIKKLTKKEYMRFIFALGNYFKYKLRVGEKGTKEDFMKDIEKALEYKKEYLKILEKNDE